MLLLFGYFSDSCRYLAGGSRDFGNLAANTNTNLGGKKVIKKRLTALLLN
jgi:hypothetical protein